MKRALPFIVLAALVGTFAQATPVPRTLADMVGVGHYNWVNPRIDETIFPVKPERFTTCGLRLLSFGRTMKTADVLAELDKRGLRPAIIEELLAFGAENPDDQLKYPIVALGSARPNMYGYAHVPVLTKGAEGRVLSLPWVSPGPVWFEKHRFLVALK